MGCLLIGMPRLQTLNLGGPEGLADGAGGADGADGVHATTCTRAPGSTHEDITNVNISCNISCNTVTLNP